MSRQLPVADCDPPSGAARVVAPCTSASDTALTPTMHSCSGALAAERVDTRGFEIEHVLRDIQTLNEWALEGRLETTAISLHAYPFVQDKYVLLPHGASMGAGYGPIVVAREPLTLADLTELEIAIPGRMTNRVPRSPHGDRDFRFRKCPSTRSSTRLSRARQTGTRHPRRSLTYGAEGLTKVLDLGEWWLLETGLPLPLGANVARRDLGEENLQALSTVLRESIRTGLDKSRRGNGVRDGVQPRDRAAPRPTVRRHVRQRSHLRLRRRGTARGRELLRRAEALGAYEHAVRVEFVP